jgi:hypothetical protein
MVRHEKNSFDSSLSSRLFTCLSVFLSIIGSRIGCEIEIIVNHIRVRSDADRDDEQNGNSLSDQTCDFMKRFAFRSISLQQSVQQLDILRAHANTVAFSIVKNNNCMLATKHVNIMSLMQKLKPNKASNKAATNTASSHSSASSVRPTPIAVPQPLPNVVTSKDK